MALAAATVLGLLFGFSFRGLLASNRVRRARVEREIAKTELSQAKAEVDALYAAQRKRKEEGAQAVGGDDTLRAELDERENRISALGEELTAARAELERLQSEASREDGGLVENLGAAAAGAVAGAVLSDGNDQELTELRDRNTWLEERVAALEADVSAAALVAAPADAPADAPEESGLVVDKLNWQTAYLRQRVDALEAKVLAQKSEAPVVTEEIETPAPVLAAVPDIEDDGARKAADEELARLRWRNRYLEGRLAYFEESGEDEPEAEAAEPDPESEVSLVAEPEPEAEPEEESEPDSTEASEADPESEENDSASEPVEEAAEEDSDAETGEEPDPEDDADADDANAAAEPEAAAAAETVHPSEAMLAELEGEQPEQVEKPDSGGDDLTAIAGIGPRIAEVLNGLGIWTYAQVAAWTPANETWIENHLAFKGRVGREKWVEQASALMEAT